MQATIDYMDSFLNEVLSLNAQESRGLLRLDVDRQSSMKS